MEPERLGTLATECRDHTDRTGGCKTITTRSQLVHEAPLRSHGFWISSAYPK